MVHDTPAHLDSNVFNTLIDRLESRDFRIRVYSFVAVGFLALSLLFMSNKREKQFVTGVDSRGYFVYLPAIVIDHSLEIEGQIRNHWGMNFDEGLLGVKTERGYTAIKYPAGEALSILPAFLVGHVVSKLLYTATGSETFAPNGWTVIYGILDSIWIFALGLLSFLIIDWWMTTRWKFDGRATAAAVLSFWIATHYAYYYAFAPFMVHVVSAFWVTGCIIASALTVDEARAGRFAPLWALLAILCLSMAVICRPTNMFLGLFIFYALFVVLKNRLILPLFKWSPVICLGVFPLLLQVSIWYALSGHLVYYSYENEGFHWTDPHLLGSLITHRHGLFFGAPLLILSVVGFARELGRRDQPSDGILWTMSAAFVVLWYLNSAWWCWWFGESFGNRAYLELESFFILGIGFALRYAAERGKIWQRASAGFIGLSFLYNYAFMALYLTNRIPRE